MPEEKPVIAVLGGSLRQGSMTNLVRDATARILDQLGATVELLAVEELDLPLFPGQCDPDLVTGDVKRLVETARAAEGFVIATPVYHGVVSGAVKNAIDYLEYLADDDPPYLEGRPVGLVAVSGGHPGLNGINSLTYSCQALRALVVPTTVAAPGAAFDDQGRMARALTQRLGRQARDLLRLVRVARPEGSPRAGDG